MYDGIELRSDDEGGATTLVSVAPPYETLSVPMSMGNGKTFRERFTPGAFGDLTGADIMATYEHDTRQVLGRTPGTLRLEETPTGLRYEVELPDTTTGRDVGALVKRGDVRGSSFEFSVAEDGDSWDENDDGTWTRTVRSATLYQVGPVLNPAYPVGTDVALRSLDAAIDKGTATPRLNRARRLMRLLDRKKSPPVE